MSLKIERLLEMINFLLSEDKIVSCKSIAEQFNISRKTVNEYIEEF